MLSWANKVVLVTGAGAGIGREYALFYGRRGATVVVNDLGSSVKGGGQDTSAADKVVSEIKSLGGKAIADYNNVVNGDKIVKSILEKHQKIDVIVNNAGILRDSSFLKMTLDDWKKIMDVHLQSVFSITNSAWKTMRDQKFGRIINTTSGSGLYGAFGQVNYAAAKLGLVGMTYSLAKEGKKYNIGVNAIAPLAASRMTESLVKKEDMQFIDPKFIVPLVGYLTHEECKESGSVFEIAGGYIAKMRYQRSEGAFFDIPFEVEQVKERMNEICDFSKKNEYPYDNTDILKKVKQNIQRVKGQK